MLPWVLFSLSGFARWRKKKSIIDISSINKTVSEHISPDEIAAKLQIISLAIPAVNFDKLFIEVCCLGCHWCEIVIG